MCLAMHATVGSVVVEHVECPPTCSLPVFSWHGLSCSREKVKPKDELQRAQQIIERSKEIIRQVSL